MGMWREPSGNRGCAINCYEPTGDAPYRGGETVRIKWLIKPGSGVESLELKCYRETKDGKKLELVRRVLLPPSCPA